MNEWVEHSILDFADILDNQRIPLSTLQREARKGSFPYYGASGIIDFIDSYLFEGDHLLISEDGENLKSRQTPIAFIASGKFWVNNHAHILKGKKPYHIRLLMYVFKNLDLHPYITGAVQPKLSKSALLSIKFELPKNPSEQQAIAEVLSSLDDKIDLLHRNNKTLEEMAETLFRQWFVEGAKEDWEVAALRDLGRIVCGKTPSTKNADFFNGPIPFVKIPDMHGNVFIINTSTSLSELGFLSQRNKSIPSGAIMVSCIATVGLVSIATKDCQTNQQINTLIPYDEFMRYYLFLVLRNLREDLLALAGGGSVTDNLNTTDFGNITIAVPSESLLGKFNELVEPMFKKIMHNAYSVNRLSSIRDSILPKLMSGQVRVKS